MYPSRLCLVINMSPCIAILLKLSTHIVALEMKGFRVDMTRTAPIIRHLLFPKSVNVRGNHLPVASKTWLVNYSRANVSADVTVPFDCIHPFLELFTKLWTRDFNYTKQADVRALQYFSINSYETDSLPCLFRQNSWSTLGLLDSRSAKMSGARYTE